MVREGQKKEQSYATGIRKAWYPPPVQPRPNSFSCFDLLGRISGMSSALNIVVKSFRRFSSLAFPSSHPERVVFDASFFLNQWSKRE